MPAPVRTKTYDWLEALLAERILVLDGAMGTMIMRLGLDEAAKRGEQFREHCEGDPDIQLVNFSDLLCLTRPDDITQIHRHYLAAGADIIETNTFGASTVGIQEFRFPREMVRELNFAAVACARKAVDEFNERTPDKPRFVAGAIGPTTKQMAISTRVDDPAWRAITFDEMVDSYYDQVAALVEAGVDILLPETFIDTLNLKACLFAIERCFHEKGLRLPVMASGTFGDGGGTFVSGQVVEAFWNAVSHVPLLTVGMNCALGPETMRPHIEELAPRRDRAGSLLSQRGPARQSHGAVQPRSRRDGPPGWRVHRESLAEHRRWLLRHHARAHRGNGRSCPPSAAARAGSAAPLAAAFRYAALHAAAGQQLHHGRRADQRDGQQGVRPADPRRQVRRSGRGRAAAGRRRGDGHRRQYGRRPARR